SPSSVRAKRPSSRSSYTPTVARACSSRCRVSSSTDASAASAATLRGPLARAPPPRSSGPRRWAAREQVRQAELGRDVECRGQPEPGDHGAQLGAFGHPSIILVLVSCRHGGGGAVGPDLAP